jgi:membrane associated rhomboid family serine protease
MAERVRRWSATRGAVLVPAIIAVNVVAFFAQQAQPSATRDYGINAIAIADGEWWRLVSGGFLHGGLIHLGFNMLIIFQLGTMLETAMGRWRFAVLYATSLLVGSAGAVAMSGIGTTSIGASTAAYGLMGALAITFHRRGLDVMRSGLGMTILLNLGLTFIIPNISIGGHLGGLAAGVAVGALLHDPRRYKGWPVVVIGIALIAASLVAGVVISDARVSV